MIVASAGFTRADEDNEVEGVVFATVGLGSEGTKVNEPEDESGVNTVERGVLLIST